MQDLSAAQLKEMIDRRDDLVVVNVLPNEQHEQKHIPGSVNVPLGDERFVERVREAAGGKEKDVVVYCASPSCDASPKAAKKLEAEGFKNVYDFEGGVEAWERQDLPLAGTSA